MVNSYNRYHCKNIVQMISKVFVLLLTVLMISTVASLFKVMLLKTIPMILDMTMVVMMRGFQIHRIDISINRRKVLHFILIGLWKDIMQDSMHVQEVTQTMADLRNLVQRDHHRHHPHQIGHCELI